MLEYLKPWLTPDGIGLILLVVGFLISLFKGREAAQKFKTTSVLLQTVIRGVENYRVANPAEKAKIRDEIQSLADAAEVEDSLSQIVHGVTKNNKDVKELVK